MKVEFLRVCDRLPSVLTMDLTPTFNELLSPRNTHTSKDISYSLEQLNEFLKQAYRIVRLLGTSW